MKNLLKKIAIGTALIGVGVGITFPIAYRAGQENGFEAGKESVRPIRIEVGRSTNLEYRFLESSQIIDASGEKTSIHGPYKTESEPINNNFPNQGNMVKKIYCTTEDIWDQRKQAGTF